MPIVLLDRLVVTEEDSVSRVTTGSKTGSNMGQQRGFLSTGNKYENHFHILSYLNFLRLDLKNTIVLAQHSLKEIESILLQHTYPAFH